jgi:hypothetical protein
VWFEITLKRDLGTGAAEGQDKEGSVKGKPRIWHESGPVTFGWWRRPSTPTMEICEG